MGKHTLSKTVCIALVLCAAAAIPSSAQTFTTLATFNGTNGANPLAGLVQATDGNFYGTTSIGGLKGNCASVQGCGTVFKITPGGTLTTVYSFCAQTNCTDGANPYAGLVQATDGNFYGTTEFGGAFGEGTVFKITPGGMLTTLHSFDNTIGNCDGSRPAAGLVQATDGSFYGTTLLGGCPGYGTVFKITPGGMLTTLHAFAFSEGAELTAALVQTADGTFYGAASKGGTSNFACSSDAVVQPSCGTVFKVTPGGTLTTLYSFDYTDGANPPAGLTQAADGNFYGTTAGGGTSATTSGFGTVFRITPAGTLTTLHIFTCPGGVCPNSVDPLTGLVQATDGNLYGTTSGGGGYGTIFEITTGGTLTTLHTFQGSDGANRYGGLVQGTDGNFYGTTTYGGTSQNCNSANGVGCGTVFSLAVGLGPFLETIPTFGRVGASVTILGNNLTGATAVSFNGTPATFTVVSSSEIQATVPSAATSGTVQVTTPSGTLNSNVPFQVKKAVAGDFDGDQESDISVWRPATGTWYVIPSSAPTTFTATQWGVSGDIPVPGDYDGGKTDMAVWRPSTGTWYVIPSSAPTTFTATQWGVSGDTPVPGDYDGDGKTDMAVWRPSNGTWYVIPTSAPTTFTATQWGINGDVPVPGDYDGDGKVDMAVWRPSTGTWYILPSSKPGTFIAVQWGMNGDTPVPGDYDGDGKVDKAVWRPSTGTWYIIPTTAPNTFRATQWGTNGDVPIQKPIGQ